MALLAAIGITGEFIGLGGCYRFLDQINLSWLRFDEWGGVVCAVCFVLNIRSTYFIFKARKN